MKNATKQTEQFKTIKGFKNYEFGNQGTIISLHRAEKRIIKDFNNGNGYRKIHLVNDRGITVKKFIHRVVLEAFLGKCPKGFEVNHINRNRMDNRLKNLEYKRISENRSHKGESHGQSKLRVEDVEAIRDLYQEGYTTYKELAQYYDVDVTTIGKVVRNETWTHLLPTSAPQITEEYKNVA